MPVGADWHDNGRRQPVAITAERKLMTTKTPLDARSLLAEANVVGSLADGRNVLAVRIPKGTAFQAWHAFKKLYDETGLWPFLTDPERDSRQPTVWEAFEANRQIATSEPSAVTAAELFGRWRAEYLEEDEDGRSRLRRGGVGGDRGWVQLRAA